MLDWPERTPDAMATRWRIDGQGSLFVVGLADNIDHRLFVAIPRSIHLTPSVPPFCERLE